MTTNVEISCPTSDEASFENEAKRKSIQISERPFTRLKNSLDHTESLTQQRRSKATGGGGDALMTNC